MTSVVFLGMLASVFVAIILAVLYLLHGPPKRFGSARVWWLRWRIRVDHQEVKEHFDLAEEILAEIQSLDVELKQAARR